VSQNSLIGLILGVALLVASFFFGRATAPKPPTVNTDTVRIHHYTTVEASFRIDTATAYLKLLKSNQTLYNAKLRLQRFSDSLQMFIDENEQLIAALDTTLDDSSSLNIQYLFPPINSFLIDYRARPYYISQDTIRITRKVPEFVKKESLWLHGLAGYGSNVALGFSVGYSWGGVGMILVSDKSPIYTLNFHYDF
jgi:hypothetical protein